MQRHEASHRYTNHIKHKFWQSEFSRLPSSLNSAPDAFVDDNDSHEDDYDLILNRPFPHATHGRRDTLKNYQFKKPQKSVFADRKSDSNTKLTLFEDNYKEEPCQNCARRQHTIDDQRRHVLQLYEQNKKLTDQLRSTILANDQYQQDIQKLKYHLRKMDSHIREYQADLEYLKQKIASNKKTNSKVDREHEIAMNHNEYQLTNRHLKRLRQEVEMYNRIVAAKQDQQEKSVRRALDFWF